MQAPADGDVSSAIEVIQLLDRIEALEKEGKYREAISLAERLVAITPRAMPSEQAYLAISLTTLAGLHIHVGEQHGDPVVSTGPRDLQEEQTRPPDHRLGATQPRCGA